MSCTKGIASTVLFGVGSICAGELILTGANNTKAQVLPTSSETFVLNTDENGDGAYDKDPHCQWGWFVNHNPNVFHIPSTRDFTAASITIGVPHSRAVSPGHLLVASIPIFDPKPDTGEAKSR